MPYAATLFEAHHQAPEEQTAMLSLGTIRDTGDPAWFEATGNLLVSGVGSPGGTWALRSVMRSALMRGWSATAICPYADEFTAEFGTHPDADTHQDDVTGNQCDDPDALDVLLASLQPGTAQHPHLVVIDNAEYLLERDTFADYGLSHRGRQELFRLLERSPHTGVALRVQRPLTRVITPRMRASLNSRLLLGDAPESLVRDTLPVRPARGRLFRFPKGQGVFYNGHGLASVTVDAPPSRR